jgi:hypothetical protein
MKISVWINADGMWGSSDPNSEGIDVSSSYDNFCQLVADRIGESYPDATVEVEMSDDIAETQVDVAGNGLTYAELEQIIVDARWAVETVYGEMEWTVDAVEIAKA